MGKVYLVGAGPGDPDLLTMKALRLLSHADVVLHDGLVSPAILELVRKGARLIDIGKRCGQKLLSQAEINTVMVEYARTSDVVVRLKGGDPSIFGRSGEEIQALTEAGVEFEVVPGITTAVAAAAASGISLTDRRYASSLVIATAHRGHGPDAKQWDRLVTSGSTLAIYMPGRDYAQLSADLQAAGLEASTPCVVVSHVGLPTQQTLFATLASLGKSEPLPAPSHIIVGQCASALEQVRFDARTLELNESTHIYSHTTKEHN